MAPRKMNGKPILLAPTGGGSPAGLVVESWQLAEVIERELPAISARCKKEPSGNDGWNGRNTDEGVGIIAFDISQIIGGRVDSITRRLWGIRTNERKVTDLAFADALCIALDTTIHDEKFVVLPSTIKGAFEMVDGYQYVKYGKTVANDKLAKSLHNFTKGFMYWDAEIALP